MTAFFHPSGTAPGGTSVASLSVADRALVSNAATISDAGASATNVYSSSKIESLMDLVEAGISYKEACIAATAAALPTCAYTIGPPGVLTASASGALPAVGGVAVLAGDRVLVTLQAEARQNGIYDVSQLGSGSTSWVLTRSEDSDGSPTSEMRGGNVVTVNEPVPSMRVLTGTGPFLMTDPVLGSNDAILWTPYGSATIPTDLYTDTLTIGGGGVDGDVAVLRADDVSVISLLGSTGHIECLSVSTPGLVSLANAVGVLQTHAADGANPHGVTPAQLGLATDALKPVSAAQAAAIEAAAVYRAPVIAKTTAVLAQSPVYAPAAGTLSATLDGALSIGQTIVAGDRILVTLQADGRENGIYIVTALGDNFSSWLLTRSAETLVGGMALTIQHPIAAIIFLAGHGIRTTNNVDPALNELVTWVTPGAAVVPDNLTVTTLDATGRIDCAALKCDAITCDSVTSSGAVSGSSITAPNITALSDALAALSSNPSFATLATSGTMSCGGALDVTGRGDIVGAVSVGGITELKATTILTNPTGAGGQLFLRRTSDNANAITLSEGGITTRKVQYYNSALDTIGATIDGADGSGTFGKLTVNGVCNATGHVTAPSLGCSGAVAAGELQPAGGIDRLGHRDVGGFSYYQLGREGGRDAILDMHNAAGAVAVRLDCAQALAQKTGSPEWVGVSDPQIKNTIVSVDLAGASQRICALNVVTYKLNANYCTATGQSPDYVWTGMLSTAYNAVYDVAAEDVQTTTIELDGTPTTLVLLDKGQAVYDQIAAHKYAIGRLDTQAAQIAALTARLDAAGL
jgi:hypothetical protein